VLNSLHVRDYALIDELEVEFGGGLNVITGETGAGKSILLGALKLILGERASTEAVRTGARKAVVEGFFDGSDDARIEAILRENEIEPNPGGAVIVRREVSASYSRAFLNDSPVTLNVLRDVAEQLIDLHGQHEHQSLLRVETHVELLDGFGGHGEFLGRYREAYQSMLDLKRERADLLRREAEIRQQREIVAFQIQEIDRVAPAAGEDEALQQERKILDNVERLHELTAALTQDLYEGEGAVYDRLVAARESLRELSAIDEAFAATRAELEQAEIVVEEAAKFLQDYGTRIEFSPERLDSVRERVAQIDALKRKYGGSLEAVLAHRSRIGEQQDIAADFEGAVAKVDRALAEVSRRLTLAARELSDKRRETAGRIQDLICTELAHLGMPHAVFDVRFELEPDPAGAIAWPDAEGGHVRANRDGADLVEFYISTNPGEPPRPLARVASGGEVSRIMLALKAILARSERLPILVFDEIDVGVSGEIARRVGETMRRLAASHQIIAITHLPQIAALAEHHFLVEKVVVEGRTRTNLRPLSGDAHTRQVATLVAGENISAAAFESARELIEAGRRDAG